MYVWLDCNKGGVCVCAYVLSCPNIRLRFIEPTQEWIMNGSITKAIPAAFEPCFPERPEQLLRTTCHVTQ